MKYFVLVVVFVFCFLGLSFLSGGCEMDVHDNPVNLTLDVDACSVLNPEAIICFREQQSYDVPRVEGQPCDANTPCGDNLVCLCSICLNTDDF